MSAHVQQASVLNGRSVVLLASFAVPMLFLYGLARNIGLTDILPEPPMKMRFIDPQPTTKPEVIEKFTPRSPLGNEQTKIVVNRPDVIFPEEEIVMARAGEPPVAGGGASGGGVVIEPVAPTPLKYSALRSTDDFYPPVSIRMSEQGTAQIRVCVSATGVLQGMPKSLKLSGKIGQMYVIFNDIAFCSFSHP